MKTLDSPPPPPETPQTISRASTFNDALHTHLTPSRSHRPAILPPRPLPLPPQGIRRAQRPRHTHLEDLAQAPGTPELRLKRWGTQLVATADWFAPFTNIDVELFDAEGVGGHGEQEHADNTTGRRVANVEEGFWALTVPDGNFGGDGHDIAAGDREQSPRGDRYNHNAAPPEYQPVRPTDKDIDTTSIPSNVATNHFRWCTPALTALQRLFSPTVLPEVLVCTDMNGVVVAALGRGIEAEAHVAPRGPLSFELRRAGLTVAGVELVLIAGLTAWLRRGERRLRGRTVSEGMDGRGALTKSSLFGVMFSQRTP